MLPLCVPQTRPTCEAECCPPALAAYQQILVYEGEMERALQGQREAEMQYLEEEKNRTMNLAGVCVHVTYSTHLSQCMVFYETVQH